MALTSGSIQKRSDSTQTRNQAGERLVVSPLLLLVAWPLIALGSAYFGFAYQGYQGEGPAPWAIQKLIIGIELGLYVPPLALIFALLAWIPYRLKHYATAVRMATLALAAVVLVVGCLALFAVS